MADGYYERGEVYWCRIDHNIGGEMGVTRPAVVISKTEFNNRYQSVAIAWCTSRPKDGEAYVHTLATGRESWIITQQVYTVDKSRFGKFMGVLSYSEMRELDTALENTFDLGYEDDRLIEEKEREIRQRDGVIKKLEQQIMELEKQLVDKNEAVQKQIANYVLEVEKSNRLYFAALDQLVEQQLKIDFEKRARRIAVVQHQGGVVAEIDGEEVPLVKKTGDVTPVIPVAESPAPVVTAPAPPTEPPKSQYGDDMVDLNTCTLTRLKKMGFTMAIAREIVAHRPYKQVEELLKVPGLKKTMYNIAKPKLYCSGNEIEVKKETQFEADLGYEEPQTEVSSGSGNKLNINTCTAKELIDTLGVRREQAYSITGYRNKHGKFGCLEDLTQVPRVGPKFMSVYRDFLEV